MPAPGPAAGHDLAGPGRAPRPGPNVQEDPSAPLADVQEPVRLPSPQARAPAESPAPASGAAEQARAPKDLEKSNEGLSVKRVSRRNSRYRFGIRRRPPGSSEGSRPTPAGAPAACWSASRLPSRRLRRRQHTTSCMLAGAPITYTHPAPRQQGDSRRSPSSVWRGSGRATAEGGPPSGPSQSAAGRDRVSREAG